MDFITTMLRPIKVEYLLLEGTPFGLRYIDLKNRIVRAFVAPRTSFDKLMKRGEMRKPGVYILYGEPTDKSLPVVYIGEADILVERLTAHRSKDFWTQVIAFTAVDETLDKGSVRYIESILTEKVLRDGRVYLENDTKPKIKMLSEANTFVIDEFIDDIVTILSVLGINIFWAEGTDAEADAQDLFIKNGSIYARGRQTGERFTVYAKSTARKQLMKSANATVEKTQSALLEQGVLRDSDSVYVFAADYRFTSASLAASLVLGRSANGLIEWKTSNGMTLKQLQNGIGS